MILVCLSTTMELSLGWGEETISISGVIRVSFVLAASDISQQFKVVQRRKITLPDSSAS